MAAHGSCNMLLLCLLLLLPSVSPVRLPKSSSNNATAATTAATASTESTATAATTAAIRNANAKAGSKYGKSYEPRNKFRQSQGQLKLQLLKVCGRRHVSCTEKNNFKY